MSDDAWGTTTGLFDDFTGTIKESHFGTDARYNNGETTLLFWKVEPIGMTVNTDDGMIEVSFPVGGGWTSYDGGETIEHTDNKDKIHASSLYGKVINLAIDQGAVDVIREKGTPLMAHVWVGLTFHFAQTTIDYGGEIGKKTRLLPDQWLKEGELLPTPSNDDLNGFKDELTAIAQASESPEQFTESAMQLTGITDHANIVMRIADGSLFEELRG